MTTRSFWGDSNLPFMRILYVSISLFILCPNPSFTQTSLDYANSLMEEGDYFRAISEYKWSAFNSKDSNIKNFCNWQISKAYYKSSKFKSSIKTLDLILKQPVLSESYHFRGNVLLGLNFCSLKNFASAEHHFQIARQYDTTGLSIYYLAFLDVEKKNWRSAEKRYDTINEKHPNTVLAQKAQMLKSDLSKVNHIHHKNPFLSASLSSIIPGSGQIYSKHYYDGLQAFFFVGAFACASYISYRYDHKMNNNYLMTGVTVSLASVFHLANIIGAYKTAQYHNIKNNELFISNYRKKALQLEPDY